MMGISKITNAAGAAGYYANEASTDYYSKSDGLSELIWTGKGAEALGLTGQVADRETFRAALEGDAGIFGRDLSQHVPEGKERVAAYDMPLSAPKSVSVLATAGGDRRLIEAHDRAVRAAIDTLEERASTRRREHNEIRQEPTGNLLVALKTEDASRNLDPQLHTHAVVVNATLSADGHWRTLDGRNLYAAYKDVGLFYRQALAAEVRRLGYEIDVRRDGTWEIRNVPESVVKAFSSRSQEVEAQLAEAGKTRDTASAAEKQRATFTTRAGKQEASGTELRQGWEERCRAQGFDARAFVDRAQERATERPYQRSVAIDRKVGAAEAVRWAAETLAERNAVFGTADLKKEAAIHGMGRATAADIAAAIDRAADQRITGAYLQARQVEAIDRATGERTTGDGWTTTRALEREGRLLMAEASRRGMLNALMSRREATTAVAAAERIAAADGHRWTVGQRTAAVGILTSRDGVVAVQGLAGTAKTNAVLATVARAFDAAGYTVRPLAPSASAAQTLGQALGREGITVARQLADLARQGRSGAAPAALGRQVWIVDEASLLSAKDMAKLLEAAKHDGARVLLTGDVRQIGSVEAGAAFRQLQANGMTTHKLEDIVRQRSAAGRDAVYAALRGDAKTALAKIEAAGGRVVEAKTVEDRRAALARDYVDAWQADHAAAVARAVGTGTGAAEAQQIAAAAATRRTLAVDPSRAGRADLNDRIRAGLAQIGAVRGPEARAAALDPKGLTKAEATLARSYEPGDVVRFGREFKAAAIEKGSYFTVARVDRATNTVTLRGADGRDIAWNPQRFGATRSEAFTPAERGVRAGDQIVWTRNNEAAGRVNGQAASVLRVDAEHGVAVVRVQTGREQELLLDKPDHQHWAHAYAQTAHAAQGRTSDRVLYHAEAFRQNLTTEKTFYVAISRPTGEARVYTDSRENLIAAVQERAGEKQAAHELTPPSRSTIGRDAGPPVGNPAAPTMEPRAERQPQREMSR